MHKIVSMAMYFSAALIRREDMQPSHASTYNPFLFISFDTQLNALKSNVLPSARLRTCSRHMCQKQQITRHMLTLQVPL